MVHNHNNDIKWNSGGRLGEIFGYFIVAVCVIWVVGLIALIVAIGKAMGVPAPF